MKKFPILLAAALLMGWQVSAQTTYPSGVTNCIARWDFKYRDSQIGTLPDVSNNSNDGRMNNLVPTKGFRNRPNEAMHFNGHTSNAIVTSTSQLNPQSITIIALVKPDSFYNGLCQFTNIIYKGYNYYIPGCWSMHMTDNVYDQADCNHFDATKQQLDFAGPYAGAHTLPNTFITPNQWYFMAITYDGTTVTNYQEVMDSLHQNTNVHPLASYTLGTALGTNTYDVYIGSTQQPVYPYWFNGDMDEVALFNKALTPTEIQSVYNYLWGTPTGISNPKAAASSQAYVANGQLHVGKGSSGPYSVEVFLANGQKIYAAESSKGEQTVDLSAYASQLFIVTIKDAQGVHAQKVPAY